MTRLLLDFLSRFLPGPLAYRLVQVLSADKKHEKTIVKAIEYFAIKLFVIRCVRQEDSRNIMGLFARTDTSLPPIPKVCTVPIPHSPLRGQGHGRVERTGSSHVVFSSSPSDLIYYYSVHTRAAGEHTIMCKRERDGPSWNPASKDSRGRGEGRYLGLMSATRWVRREKGVRAAPEFLSPWTSPRE